MKFLGLTSKIAGCTRPILSVSDYLWGVVNVFFKTLILIGFMILISLQSYAQCAMCRATLENNVSNGQAGIGAGINFGILYLFAMPYLMIMVVGYFWYKKSRQNESKKRIRRSSSR